MAEIMCFARGHQGSWEALCVDFDIAVQGASFEEVRSDLEAAIRQYVSFANEQDAPARAKLLGRRAPWHVNLAWIARVAWHGLLRSGSRDTPAAFPVACPA